MRHNKEYTEKCRRRGRISQQVQENKRLAAAFDYRPIESFLVFEMDTHNPRTWQRHHLEIRHDQGNGDNRYSFYIDGKRTRKQWSRTGLITWLFGKIDSVINFN